MNLLLDSHTLLWALLSPEKLSERARREIVSSPRLFFSALSEGPDPLEPEREGGCLHVGRIGTWGLDLKSASGLLARRPP